MSQHKQILRYGDLIVRGYGSRTKIWRDIKNFQIPVPSDFMGRPGWLLETIEEFEKTRPQFQSKESRLRKTMAIQIPVTEQHAVA